MPQSKKAVRKVARKPAARHHHNVHDLRRAFEHLGRVEALRATGLSAMSLGAVDVIVMLAAQAWQSGHAQEAADLLRAAEHIGFGGKLYESAVYADLPPALHEAVEAYYREMLHRADHYWPEASHPEEFVAVYKFALEMAGRAMERTSYQAALEYIRAAEVLTHVRIDWPIPPRSNWSVDAGSHFRLLLQVHLPQAD